MTSESAILGTPSILLCQSKLGYISEQAERYGMVIQYSRIPSDLHRSVEKGLDLLKNPGIKEEWSKKREKMLTESIDTKAFMEWFLENYPQSVDIMTQTSDFQDQFKQKKKNK